MYTYLTEENRKELEKYLEKINNNPDLKAKFDELFLNFRRIRDNWTDEELQEAAVAHGFRNVYEQYLYEIERYTGIEKKYDEYQRDEKIKNDYHQLVIDNYEVLLREGCSKEKLDKIVNGDELSYPNMDDSIVAKLFIIKRYLINMIQRILKLLKLNEVVVDIQMMDVFMDTKLL